MNLYFIGSILNLASLYMIAGVGCIISLKGGALNLGGEGQIYTGGLVAAVILTSSWSSVLPSPVVLAIAFFCAMAASAAMSLFSGFLAYKKHADYLFTSFIISTAVIPFIDGLITGPFINTDGNLLATPFIATKFRLTSIMPPSTMNISFIFAILFCLNYYYCFTRTQNGRKLCIFGTSLRFATYCGYKRKRLIYSAAIATGALHGLCGAIAVMGTYYTCHLGFYRSMGWNAFTAALLSGSNPLLLIPSSLLLAGIIKVADNFTMYNNFGFDMSGLIQAFILFVIACLRRRRNDI